MIIKKADLEGFGKFSGKSLEFKPGFNLIKGNNEDGKTTFMSFIKMLFYSSSSKTEGGSSADLSKSMRKKYRPWNGTPMGGSLEFEQGKTLWRIQKQFLKSASSDKTKIYSITHGEEKSIENPNEAGEYFFDMDLGEFERSVFIGQSGGFSSEASADSLAMRIANLSVSGDENVSHEMITKRLNDAIEELVSKRETKGLLIEARDELSSLNLKLQQLKHQEDAQRELFEKIKETEKEISHIETKLKAIENSKNREYAQKELTAYYNLSNKINRLSTIDGQFLKYSLPIPELKSLVTQCDELEEKISRCLEEIERLSLLQQNAPLTQSEYDSLAKVNEEISALKEDITKLDDVISELNNEFVKKMQNVEKSAKRLPKMLLGLSFVIALGFAALGLSLSLPALYLPAGGLLVLGLILFAMLSKNTEHKSSSNPSVRLAKQNLEDAIKELSGYEDNMEDMSFDEIRSRIHSKLSEKQETICLALEKFGCADMIELCELTNAAKTDSLTETTNKLGQLREEFVSVISKISPKATYPAAKGLYLEITDSFKTRKETMSSIETICATAGITDTSSEFISKRILELAEIVDAPEDVSSKDYDRTDLESKLSELRKTLSEYQRQILPSQFSETEIVSKISEAEDLTAALESRHGELKIAVEFMEDAINDANRGIGSHLSEKTSEYLNMMTNGKYSNVSVSRDFNVETKSGDGEPYREWKFMSSGAIDRIYLALRLAATDIIAKDNEPLPLFLDDILAQYDEENCKVTLLFLKKYLEDSGSVSQILFFTCHEHISKLVFECFDNINQITL